jgi:uncharacterized protein (DUF488 family)
LGHGTRPLAELVETLADAGVGTLVDVRRFPGSRWNPQFNRTALADAVTAAGIGYLHAVDLGGRLSAEPGEERFRCIGVAAFRSYAARMTQAEWQSALADTLRLPAPCFLCAETSWTRCHRRLISDQLHAHGHRVVHLLGSGRHEAHELSAAATVDEGRLSLCGHVVG